ncbi:Chemotaxis protein CheY [Candidatus Terasakiella magnetica]|uniref:Chemotaxis protein CheY n=1 Tax=Candidatus Terasakiella magnetica TaxID=1867952 RepID=A0A1C3RI24_9PROT|nr:response regulator transcription factor [Candidatus Terasakiella magnetica]SCA56931.1 Chemotaxis protein CheY [Candidatus Terasakiella magnetica]
MNNPKVLIVDDTQTIRTMMAVIVETMGATVVGQANDGIEAEEMFHELKPDLTLLDIEMPNRNGIDTLKSLIKTDPTAKIVMLTANNNTVVAESCIHYGAAGYLQKELSSDIFKNGLEVHLKSA